MSSALEEGNGRSGPYQVIAEAMVAQAPEGWTMLELEAEVGDGYVDTGYRAVSTQAQRSFALPDTLQSDVEDALTDLQKSTEPFKSESWSRCVFTVFPNGRFKFDIVPDDQR